MKDPELYDFFKKGSEAFDEMPSADLWNKIDAHLKEGKKTKPFKSLLIKALLFLVAAALIVWIYFEMAKKAMPLENQIQNNRPVKENKIYTEDTLIQKDSLTELPNVTPTIKTPVTTIKKASFKEENYSTDERNLDEQTSSKPDEQIYKLEITNQKTEEVAETKVFTNRIVVRATKKLTDAQYELLLGSALEKNKDSYGMMLIIIAPEHATYRKVIPSNRLDVKTTVKKTRQMDSVSIKSPKVITTNEVYFNEILKNQQNVDVKPEFPGGAEAFYKYISKNFKIPDEDSIKGKIIVQFIVEIDGTLSDIKILKDLGYGTGEEAIRALKNCPKWTPGFLKGKPVRVMYKLPIEISK
ncbi:MAG: energy transducer TonB [Flavobacterium sp.]|nr:energy transducer TonB [Flavobacterium sp.]